MTTLANGFVEFVREAGQDDDTAHVSLMNGRLNLTCWAHSTNWSECVS